MKTLITLLALSLASSPLIAAESASSSATLKTGIPALDSGALSAPLDVLPGSMPPPISPSVKPRVPALDTASPPSASETGSLVASVPPPPVNLLAGVDSVLTVRERQNLAVARQWIDGKRDHASVGSDGAVVFRIGTSMPSVICAPLFVCDIALQPGEVVNDVKVGDSVRWKVTPSTSGSPLRTTHVIVKPADIGLTTNLIVATDRRIYNLKLVSREHDWMPTVSFSYPEDEAAQWEALAREQSKHLAETVIPQTGQSLGDLDFAYSVSGSKSAWRPLRVYSDGTKTYIQFPESMKSDETPALVALGADKKEQMVNYRLLGDRYVVDKVLDRAILVSGVGRHQVKVKIAHTEGR
jgi:type IV secretion system protein TrbG